MTSDHQLLVARVPLRIRLKRPKKKVRTFLTDAELKKLAARTNITCPDSNDPNTMREDIKTEITRARELVIKKTPCRL